MTTQLARDLAHALGLPKWTTRAVLTLAVGEVPTLDLVTLVMDGRGQPVRALDANEVKRIRFSYRLVPFAERWPAPWRPKVAFNDDGYVMTIQGVRYGYGVFDNLGFGRIGSVFRLERREDGCLTLRSFSREVEERFCEMAGVGPVVP